MSANLTNCSKLGSQKPTFYTCPDYDYSEWESVHAINASGGIEMIEWQDFIMCGWTGRDVTGRWAATTCGASVSRQNGKTLGVTEPRMNWGMLKLGEEVIYTSHLQKTSTETFEGMANFFDQPALRKYIKAIKTALGREQIILKEHRAKDGTTIPEGRVKFLARTRNGGRGQHGDLLVFDEALELSAESQASFLPAISASRNPQVIYISSPPSAESQSEVFRNLRERAKSGNAGKIAWYEWAVDEIGDVHDVKRWYATNPSLGILISEDTVSGECDQLGELSFAIERLGYWLPVGGKKDLIFTSAEWNACATEDEPSGIINYGVKIAPDGSEAALSACWKNGNACHVELVDYTDTRRGFGRLADWLNARADKCGMLAVDGRNADALTSRLEAFKNNQLRVMRTSDAIAAAALLVDGIRSGNISHYGQEELNEQALNATRRHVGRDAWCIGGEHSTAIESAADAVWAAQNNKNKPGRKARIG